MGAALLLGLPFAASAQIATGASGVVVFEAERATTNTARGAHAWVFTNDLPVFSGTGFVRALPDIGSNIQVNVTGTSPELVYPLSFSEAGNYRVWMRGYATGPNDDSVHYGLNGATSSAWNLNLSSNAWRWTNLNTSIGTAVMTVPSAGTHTFHLWMREDGLRIDRIALVTSTTFKAGAGNGFHTPSVDSEADLGRTMRNPLRGVGSNTAVEIISGNQYQGGSGDPGNQLQTGSAILYKPATGTVWSSQPLYFHKNGTTLPNGINNKYYSNAIPAGLFLPGETVQYYLRMPYSDHLPAFVYGNANLSLASEFEVAAQADPFTFTVEWPLQPEGGFLAITNGDGSLQVRVYTNTGHLALLGPDLNGTPLANQITFAPGQAEVAGETYPIAAVTAWSALSNGLELAQQLAGATVQARLTFTADRVVRYAVTNWGGLTISKTLVTAPSDAGEHFYGFGEKFNTFDQAGKRVRIMTDDPPGDKDDRSYKVAPWFISTRGYGFHLDSSAESYFDMRATLPDRYLVENNFSSLVFNVVYGPRLADVLTRYTAYTGRPRLSPPWAYAPWISSDHWRDGGEIRYLLTKYRQSGLAGSALVFDSPWETAYNDFTWNAQQFQDGGTYEGTFYPGFASINDMMAFIRSNGFKAICWMTPFVNTSSVQDEPGITNGIAANYAAASNLGYFVRSSPGGPPLLADWWKGTGSPIDFTNPGAVQWLQAQLSNLVAQSGGVIGGFKTDDGESGNPPGSYIPATASYFDGRTGVEMANGYSAEYHKHVWDVLGTNGLLFARSGFTGSHAYPGYWSGDNYPKFGASNGLPSVIVASQSAAMSGYAIWSSDIGGYQNAQVSSTPTNLFMRWTQFGAFSPLMQMHRQVGLNNQYPWSYGALGLTNYHVYSHLHTALFPYLYSYVYESSTNGLPIMRPLVLMNPGDANTYGIQHTFLFGNELLVAAMITNNQTVRDVYLPAGTWIDWWNNTRYAGGQLLSWTNADQGQYPIFVRQGSIIPTLSSNVDTLLEPSYMGHSNLVTWDGALEFLVYPDAGAASFGLYDGSVAYCISNDTVVTFDLSTSGRVTSLRILGSPPAGVERNGVRLPAYTNDAAYQQAALGWRHESSAGFTHVKFAHPGGSVQVTLGPDTVGDGIPNSWRQVHFGVATTTNAQTCATCDADEDGLSNGEEYRAGTDPMDSNDVLRVTTTGTQVVSGTNNVVVSWLGQPGIPYGIGWKNNLADTSAWQTVLSVYTGSGVQLNWFDNGLETGSPPEGSPTGCRFYRVLVP
jgi:alpha-D-xyloside xylohydrolase